jgi:hypothetical protein
MFGHFLIRLSVFAALLWLVFWIVTPLVFNAPGDLSAAIIGRMLAISVGGAVAIVVVGFGLGWVFGAAPIAGHNLK